MNKIEELIGQWRLRAKQNYESWEHLSQLGSHTAAEKRAAIAQEIEQCADELEEALKHERWEEMSRKDGGENG